MLNIEKLNLMKQISEKLNADYDYTEIMSYFNMFGIDFESYEQNYTNIPSQIVLALSEQDNTTIKTIGKELNLFSDNSNENEDTSDIWEPNTFKCFISHLTKDKVSATNLQTEMSNYNISSFVAHKDIKPTKKWENVILRALVSCNSLIAILTKDFNSSSWTDQEVGIAMGRDKFIIPIKKEIDPYGFVSKYQAITTKNMNAKQVTDSILNSILNEKQQAEIYFTSLASKIVDTYNESENTRFIDLMIENIDYCPKSSINILYKFISNKDITSKDETKIKKLNQIFKNLNYREIDLYPKTISEDDLPF
jgi:hypothetical protein